MAVVRTGPRDAESRTRDIGPAGSGVDGLSALGRLSALRVSDVVGDVAMGYGEIERRQATAEPAAEVNLVARNLHSTDAWLLKIALVVLVVCLQPALRPKYSAVGEGLALLAVAAGFLGCGSNLAAISWVAG